MSFILSDSGTFIDKLTTKGNKISISEIISKKLFLLPYKKLPLIGKPILGGTIYNGKTGNDGTFQSHFRD